MKSLINLLLIWCCFNPIAYTQYSHVDVLKGEKGNQLFEDLQLQFTPASTLDYAIARDTMFLKIDAVDRILECVYTGMKLPIPEGFDPTDVVYMNGDQNGINTEHTYPQGFGLEFSKGRSDMHHLFPSRVKTNGDRGNLPFGESPDSSTKRWYLNTSESNSVPNQNIDEYSELGNNGVFEPRESHKGDVARAMFYVYTIYRTEVSEDTNFFNIQKQTLCDWHDKDPVDQKEWERSQKIAKYQDNKANPFVLDCSLAARLYCDHISEPCALLSDVTPSLWNGFQAVVAPNPVFNQGAILLKSDRRQTLRINIFDTYGKTVHQQEVSYFPSNETYYMPLDDNLLPGIYYIMIQNNEGNTSVLPLVKM